MNFTKKLKEFLFFGSSVAISNLILGVFWLYLASIVTKTEYGELGYLMGIVNVTVTISLFGFRTAIMVYEPKKENIFFVSFVVTLISTSICSLIIFILSQNISASLLILGLAPYNLILSYLTSKKRYGDFSKHVLLRSGSIVIFSILLYYVFGLYGILFGHFVSTLFILKELPEILRTNKINFSIIKSKFWFLINTYVNRLSKVFFLWGDKIIIGSMFGFGLLGNFHFAAQYFLLLQAIPFVIYQYLLPQESEGLKNKNLKIFLIILSCSIALISIIIIPYGVNMFLPKYNDSILLMQIMSLAIIPFSLSTIQVTQFLGKENSRTVLIGSVIQSASYLVFIIVLGQIMGINGIAIGFLISAIIRTIFHQIVK